MKKYLLVLIYLIAPMPLAATAAERAGTFYDQLKYIESVRLKDIAETRKQLDKLAQYTVQFDQNERDLYQLLNAHSLAMQAKYDHAREILNALTSTSESIDIRARAYSILAAIENIQGNHIEAFVALDKSLELFSKVSDRIYRLDILQNAVGVYKTAELVEYALEVSRRHLTEANRSKQNEPLCHANYELASIEIMAHKVEMATERLKSTRRYCEKADERLVLLEIEASMAELAIINKRYDDALQIMESIDTEINDFGWDLLKSRAQIHFAEIYFARGELGKAEEFALQGYELASRSNDRKRILGATAVLAKVYSKNGQHEQAIKYYKEYMDIMNERQNKIRQRKIAFQTVRNQRMASMEDSQ